MICLLKYQGLGVIGIIFFKSSEDKKVIVMEIKFEYSYDI